LGKRFTKFMSAKALSRVDSSLKIEQAKKVGSVFSIYVIVLLLRVDDFTFMCNAEVLHFPFGDTDNILFDKIAQQHILIFN
jgi:hypothetical protein